MVSIGQQLFPNGMPSLKTDGHIMATILAVSVLQMCHLTSRPWHQELGTDSTYSFSSAYSVLPPE